MNELNKNYIVMIVAIFLGMMLLLINWSTLYAKQATCPQTEGWTKVDSNDLSSYPVTSASAYCFKAGSDNSQGCNGGTFDSWPQPEGTCGLSHWSYFIDTVSTPILSPTINPASEPTVVPTAKPTPIVEPTTQPSPSSTPIPSPTPQPESSPQKEEKNENKPPNQAELHKVVDVLPGPVLGYK